jgi:hypothetical protein
MEGAVHPALRRVLREAGDAALADKLAALPGSDLTTVLLEVQRRRASRITPAEVMRNYGRDRFAAPAAVGFGSQRRAEDAMLAALPAGFEAGDGGFTDWTAQLLGSRKERLLISGYGIDRIALASGA